MRKLTMGQNLSSLVIQHPKAFKIDKTLGGLASSSKRYPSYVAFGPQAQGRGSWVGPPLQLEVAFVKKIYSDGSDALSKDRAVIRA